MHLVNDIYLEAPAARRIQRTVKQLPHIVHLGVGRRIQFYQVNETSAVDLLAGATLSTRRWGNAGRAIQRLGKNARYRGLSDPTRAGEKIGMMQTILREGIAECSNNVLLPRQLRESLGPPFARKDSYG